MSRCDESDASCKVRVVYYYSVLQLYDEVTLLNTRTLSLSGTKGSFPLKETSVNNVQSNTL